MHVNQVIYDAFEDVKAERFIHIICLATTKPNRVGMHISNEDRRLKLIRRNVNASVYADNLGDCLEPPIRDNFRITKKCIF